MRRRFATLAVVHEAEGLEPDAMQAIAREFNHPETVFIFAPADSGHRARLRIFTPARELPFAGHPTVGTAVLLALSDGAAAGDEFALEEGIGPVRCTLEWLTGASGTGRRGGQGRCGALARARRHRGCRGTMVGRHPLHVRAGGAACRHGALPS